MKKEMKNEEPKKKEPKAKKPKEPKVKAAKTKPPKTKAAQSKAKPAKQKVKTKKGKPAGVKEKNEVPFLRSIRLRLILSFMVPVVCIVVLGVVSYQKASSAIVNNYQESTSQTVDMVRQYVELIVSSEKDNFKSYLIDADLKKYFGGLMEEAEEASTRKKYTDEIRNTMALDRKLVGLYFLADGGLTVAVNAQKLPEDAYSQYMATPQGENVAQNSNDWYLLGQDETADAAVNIETSEYSLRLARKMGNMKSVFIINLSSAFIRESMQSLDPGEDGYVALITSDGKEFYSHEDIAPEEPLIYGTDFYQKAMESDEMTGDLNVTIDGKDYLFVYSRIDEGKMLTAALIPLKQLMAQTSDIQQLSIILTVVAALIALGLGTLISNQMSGTIQYILRQLRKVAHGDLTVRLTTKKKDEFGMLCAGVNDTVAHVKELIVNVNDVSSQLTDAAAYVSDASGTFMNTSQDIQQAVSEIEIGVNKLDSGSEDCLNQMDSLSGKISNVSVNADEIGKLTSSTGETISNGIRSVQGLTSSAESTSEITKSVIDAIEELEGKSKSISKIVSAINDIAEQTNLLSLNASIEAARAGEAGRGFAVVAEEIRKLSDQCLNSAGQISNIVNEIVEKTGEVVVIARQAEEVVSTQVSAVEETTDSFRSIDQKVKSLLEALGTISDNVQEMNSSRSETLEAIEGISAVSAETAACSTSVYSTAGTQLDASQDLGKAAQQLRERSDKLVEILKTFTV